MTNGLASDSDKFLIIIKLRRAQKFGDNPEFLAGVFFVILAKINCPTFWGAMHKWVNINAIHMHVACM